MALPTSRNRTFVNGATKVKAADMNDLQDFLIAAFGRGYETVAGLRANADAGEVTATGVITAAAAAQSFGWGRGGCIYATGTARRIGSRKGVIGQVVAGELLLYELNADEILQTVTTADATNPRIDTIQVKIDAGGLNGYTTLTWSLLTGTPAATPAQPALTAGYTRWADILVPATYNAVFLPDTHFRDWRIPIAQRYTEMIWPDGFRAKTFGNGLINTGDGQQARLQASAANQYCQVVPRGIPGRSGARLLRFALHCKIDAAGHVKLCRQGYAAGSPTVLKDYTATFCTGATATGEVDLTNLAGDGPWWQRGYQGGPEAFEEWSKSLVLDIKSGANLDYVAFCEMQWAG